VLRLRTERIEIGYRRNFLVKNFRRYSSLHLITKVWCTLYAGYIAYTNSIVSRFYYTQFVKKLFETNKRNFSGSKSIIDRRITFNSDEIGAFSLEQFFYILYILFTTQVDIFQFSLVYYYN
jgi:hypothetical protein